MKLFGSTSKSKHAGGAHTSGRGGSRAKKKPNIALRVFIILLCIAAAVGIAVYALYHITSTPPDTSGRGRGSTAGEKEPETAASNGDLTPVTKPDENAAPEDENTENTDNSGTDETGPEDNEPAPGTSASGLKYTFAIMGMDDGNGNSDTIMTATFDADNHTLNVVSIPRDTLVNVSWSTKKANTWYSFGGKEQGVLNGMRDILGYQLDYYVIIDLEAFEKLVDGIGGVYYDVPQDMKYSDPYQDLYIDIKAGPQTLSGEDAMKVVRFRRYAEGDIKRITVQQDFLKAMMKQILSNVASVPLTTLADIVLNDVDTDMDYGTIMWFAKELLKLDAENVTFHTLPGNYGDYVVQNGRQVSYVTIYVNQWLEMINTYLNPFDEDIRKSELDILTKDGSGNLYATSGVRRGSAGWGAE